MVRGLLATGSTIALFAAGAFPPGTRPALVVAAGITVLLSGLSVVGTVQDAISHLLRDGGRARRRDRAAPPRARDTPATAGPHAYRGFYQLAVEGVAGDLVTATLALAIGLALAAGVALGDFPVRTDRGTRPAIAQPAPDDERQ